MTVADHLLVDILDELRSLRAQLVQEPPVPAPEPEPEPEPGRPELVLITEPAPVAAPDPAPARVVHPPPRRGKGSSRDEWATYADELGVSYAEDARQGDIIAAIEDWRVEERW